MQHVRSKSAGLLGAALCATIWGCGGGGSAPSVSASTEQGKVSGKVIIKGKPASKGTVTFDPSNVARPMAGPQSSVIGRDGSYSLTTLVGKNSVSVTSPDAQKAGIGYVTIEYEVRGGDNSFDIDLPPPGAPPPPPAR